MAEIACQDFVVQVAEADAMSHGAWAGCPTCVELVREEDLAGLCGRVGVALRRRGLDGAEVGEVLRLVRTFWEVRG